MATILKLRTDPPKRRRSARERQRQYQKDFRQRQKRGEHVGRVPYGLDVIEALILSGRLDEITSRDWKAVDREAGLVLQEWAAHWLRSR